MNQVYWKQNQFRKNRPYRKQLDYLLDAKRVREMINCIRTIKN